MGPLNVLLCGSCLVLLGFESAFGICLGCKLYNLFSRTPAQLCPGGTCDLPAEKGKAPTLAQWGVVLVGVVLAVLAARWVLDTAEAPVRDSGMPDDSWANDLPAEPASPASAASPAAPAVSAEEAERCKVPEFAKAIGHEQKWKLHNGCK
jgi:hypothetical protein